MKNLLRNLIAATGIALSVLASASLAFAQSTVVDVLPGPVPSASNSGGAQSEVLVQSYSVTGGTLYWLCSKSGGTPAGGATPPAGCGGPAFVPTTVGGGYTRWLNLSDARLDTGVISTATTGSSTSYGVARTAGTSYDLVGAATSSSAVTTKAMWEVNTAPTYVAGAALPVVVNANYTGSGTITAASTTLTVNAYTEVNGVETAITGITSAQQFTGTANNYTFVIPATAGLTVGQHLVIEVVMLVTTASGANTGQINAVGLTN